MSCKLVGSVLFYVVTTSFVVANPDSNSGLPLYMARPDPLQSSRPSVMTNWKVIAHIYIFTCYAWGSLMYELRVLHLCVRGYMGRPPIFVLGFSLTWD